MKKLIFAGLICAFGPAAFAQNLIQNGSFETGDTTDWTVNSLSVYSGVNTAQAEDGSYSLQLGALTQNADDIFQMVSDTAGATYTLSFWDIDTYQEGSAGDELLYNGNVLYNADPGSSWSQHTFTVTGTGSDKVEIAGWDSPAYMYVDNYSMVASTPEPASMALLGLGAFALLRRRRR